MTVNGALRAAIGNCAVARVFSLVGDLLEIKGGDDAAKGSAYRRAARSVEALSEEVSALHRDGRLRDIPGVGEALARKIAELIDTGRLTYFDRLTSEIPSGVLDLLRVPGIGVKTAGLLWRELGVAGVGQLEEACGSGALRRLPGLGPKKEEAIQAGIAAFKRGAGRFPLSLARPVGEALVRGLASMPGVARVSLAGSVRRWCDTVGDVNIVVATSDPVMLLEAAAVLPEVREIHVRETRPRPRGLEGIFRATLHCGLPVDLRLVPSSLFGAALVYFTGSPAHNTLLAARAASRGLDYGEGGLAARLRADGGLTAASPGDLETEDDLYRALGLDFIAPELREEGGETETVEAGGRPEPHLLLEAGDIRGDLHVHSDWSDGLASMAEMADAARLRGYEYLAICDHTKSLAMARGLDEKRLLAQIDAIEAINATAADGFRLLAGTEVDVLADGGLDLPDSALSQLDIVNASIHSRLRRPAAEITERLLAAVKNENVDVLAHPTGRLIGRREASELDLETVFEAAAKQGTMLEINAYPDRLDLKDVDARRAREVGCRLTISTDAHHLRGLEDMAYGVATARRAGLAPADVANTRSLGELRKLLAR